MESSEAARAPRASERARKHTRRGKRSTQPRVAAGPSVPTAQLDALHVAETSQASDPRAASERKPPSPNAQAAAEPAGAQAAELPRAPAPRMQTMHGEIARVASELEMLRSKGSLTVLSMLGRSDEALLSSSVPVRQVRSLLDVPHRRRAPTEWIAIDCEMVGVGPRGSQSALGRVSVVNKWGYPLLDIYVVPEQRITHWRTRWSGLSAAVFQEAAQRGELRTFAEANALVRDLLPGRVVIGHSINNDLRVLGLTERPPRIIDTQAFSAYSYFGLNKQPGLKNALDTMFDIKIQTKSSGHDSIEDAQATMLLFRVLRPGFESEMKNWAKSRR